MLWTWVGDSWPRRSGPILALVKPQFEAGRGRTQGGVVRDPEIHREVLVRVARAAAELGLMPRALIASPILGAEGNREFFLELDVPSGRARGSGSDAEGAPPRVDLPHDWPTRVAEVIRA